MTTLSGRVASAISGSALLSAVLGVALAAASALIPTSVVAKKGDEKPTVVLVHGAFAGSSSWNLAASRLLAQGYPVVAVANPLRSVKGDARYVASFLDAIPGPVVLVGHSYGGNVISVAATGKRNVKALIFVSGLAPDAGETAAALSGKFPGSTLGPTLAPPVQLADGNKDLYIVQEKFHNQFAADVPLNEAILMAAEQRPITEAALNEAGESAAWKSIPSWFLYGSLDKNVPPAVHAFMAKRAGARRTVEVKGASHVVMISHPDALVRMVNEAANYRGE